MFKREEIWQEVTAGKKSNSNKISVKKPRYIKLSNAYSSLPLFNDPLHTDNKEHKRSRTKITKAAIKPTTKRDRKSARRNIAKCLAKKKDDDEEAFIDYHIT